MAKNEDKESSLAAALFAPKGFANRAAACKDLVTNGFPLIGRQRFQTLLEQVPLGSHQLRNSCQPVTTHRTPATTEPVGSRLADSQHTSINIGMKLCQWG